MVIKVKTWNALTDVEKMNLLIHLSRKDGKYLIERSKITFVM